MTGLLYLIVIAMWGAVLVPIWLKNHDRAKVEKSVREPSVAPEAKWHWAKREVLDAKQQAYVRRRRVLMTLISLVIGTIVMSASGNLSPILALPPVLLLAGFVITATRVAHAAKLKPAVKAQSRQTSAAAMVSGVASQAVETATISTQVPQNSHAWAPVESPVPSYVLAARATEYPRNLDAQKPWTAQEMLEQAAQLRESRALRLKEAQQRLEEARAVALEKARKAALGAAKVTYEAQERRAVNE